jgi:putative transposase
MWHIDTTVIRLLDGTRAYLHCTAQAVSQRSTIWDCQRPVSSGTAEASS